MRRVEIVDRYGAMSDRQMVMMDIVVQLEWEEAEPDGAPCAVCGEAGCSTEPAASSSRPRPDCKARRLLLQFVPHGTTH